MKQVACGDSHSMIVTQDGLVYAFGNNSGKQLGLKNCQNDVKVPTLIEDLILSNPAKVTSVACANSFSIAVTNQGEVYSWGTNLYGALGLSKNLTSVETPTLLPKIQQVRKVSARHNHSIFLTQSGEVFMAGKGDCG